MIDFLKLVGIVGGLAFLAWFIHQDGYKSGRNDLLIEVQAQAIADRESANADLVEQLESGKAQDAQERVEVAALNESIQQLAARSGSIGAQLRSALNASNLAVCLHPDDVRSVRNDGYEQARSAAASANQARSALRDNPL